MILPRRTTLAVALSLALGATASVASATTPVIAALPSVESIDAARGNASLLILRAGIFDPVTQHLETQPMGAAPAGDSAYAIVQFHPDALRARKDLAAKGIEFLAYVPNNAYFVRLNGQSLDRLREDPAVRWAGRYTPEMKLDPSLWTASRANSPALQADGRYELMIEGFSGVPSARIQAAIERSVPQVEITMRSERADAAPYVRARVEAADLDALIQAATATDGVAFVSPWREPHTMNAGGIGALQGNLTGACTGSGPICGPTPLFDQGITGSGQIAAVADSGTTPNAAWFATIDKGDGPHTAVTFADDPAPVPPAIGALYPDNKIIGYWNQPGGTVSYDYVSGHGTHTSGTVVGDAAGTFGANTFLAATPYLANHDLADGMAPGAQLLMQDIGGNSSTSVIVQDFEGTLLQAAAVGAYVHNNSWGSDNNAQYTPQDANVDRATRKDEHLLVVISAGNDVSGPMAVGNPGVAKNALTVAALGHAGSLAKASYSNAGPTADGRMKPDVAAPGSSTISARNSTAANPVTDTVLEPQTRGMSGTSMASPTMAGNAVLVRQYFADGFYPRGFPYMAASGDRIFADGFDGELPPDLPGVLADAMEPTGAVLKAVILNSTVPTTSPATFPNTGTGWGRPWLDSNLWFKNTIDDGDDSRRLRVFERTNAAGMETGDVHEYVIQNVEGGSEFRATLTWYDPPAAPGAASTLINNLDLEVVGPGGTYLGNVFSGNESVTGGSADTKDTVEQVRLTAPSAGTYTIRVKATSVPGTGETGSDRQGYGLAVSGRFAIPDPVAAPAPQAIANATNGTSGIGIDADPVSGAQSYQLYRADNTDCATARPGDFHLVAHGTTLPLVDTRSQGGYQYAYKLRAIKGDIEGEASACIDVVSNDECTLRPDFDTASLIGDGSNASCAVNLSWAAATSNCPAASTVTYTVERDNTDPYFGSPFTIATGLTAPSFSDTDVSTDVHRYYRVRAVDAAGNASQSSRVLNITTSGEDGPDPGSFLDDVDNRTYMELGTPWQITSTAASQGFYSYHSSADGEVYPDNSCYGMETPALTLTAGAVLSFQARYDIEYQWDGAVMEISTDGGASWTDLPPDGGYPSSLSQTQNPPINGCGYPASQGAFNGVSTASSNSDPNNGSAAAVFKPFTRDLSAYVGQTVKIRWRMATDPAVGYDGFFLDNVRIDGAPGSGDYTCTP